jgi:uncharacterized protein YecE (DUF72 family)
VARWVHHRRSELLTRPTHASRGQAIRVGTSSWADPGFLRYWYPKGLSPARRLAYYAERFDCVELNASFYSVPAERQAELWADRTPDGFLFDVKLHRYLSFHATEPDALPADLREHAEVDERRHLVRDRELERELARRMRAATAPLADQRKLGAFLLQLTPGFSPRRNRLAELDPVFDELEPVPVAVEFRHRGWVERGRLAELKRYLSGRDAVLVGVDAPRDEHFTILPPVDAVTNRRLAYLRCHGRNLDGYLRGRSVAERFDYDYPTEELEEIAERARVLADEAEEVHVMFNNNARDYAPKAARRLLQALGQPSH